jgi:predicted dehydrogenase
MPAFRVAVLGVDHPHGPAWRRALAALGPDVEIVAIVPRFGDGTTSLEEQHSDCPRFETVEALLADGRFDGALVTLANHEAPDAIVRLAEAGKHILAEKPVAGSADDARRAAAAVEAAGVAFQSGYMWRYDDGADRLKRMFADGRFGPLVSVEMSYHTSNVARRGPEHYLFDPVQSVGGFFSWLACHWLDLFFYLTGETVVGVSARVGTYGGTPVGVEDGGAAILDLAGGGIATFVGGYWIPRWAGESRWSFRGRDRWVHWDPQRPGTSGVLEIHGPQPQWDAMEETLAFPADNTPGYGGQRGVRLIRDWLDSARSGGRPCRNTPASMVAALELIDRIYESSREGRRVECRVSADG